MTDYKYRLSIYNILMFSGTVVKIVLNMAVIDVWDIVVAIGYDFCFRHHDGPGRWVEASVISTSDVEGYGINNDDNDRPVGS